MAIEIQVSAEGVRHYHDQQANTIFVFYPLLYDRGSECGQVVEQMAILLKDRPQNAGHRKNEAGIRNIGKGSRLLPKPQKVARKYRSESESLPLLLG